MHLAVQQFSILICKRPQNHPDYGWPVAFSMKNDDPDLRRQGLEVSLNYYILAVSTNTIIFYLFLCFSYFISKRFFRKSTIVSSIFSISTPQVSPLDSKAYFAASVLVKKKNCNQYDFHKTRLHHICWYWYACHQF